MVIQADQLVLLVGEEFARYTTAHIKALRSDSTTLRKTTLELCRGIKRDAGVTRRVKQIKIHAETETSAAFTAFLCTLIEVRNKLSSHMLDTAEHDANRVENHKRVLVREQKAGKERVALESQLKVESRERQRQASRTEVAESRIQDELDVILDNTAARAKQFKSEATRDDSMETSSFDHHQEELVSLLRTLQVQLSNMQDTYDDTEAALQKKVSDNEKKLASNLGDYDDEVGSIEATLREESSLLKDMKKKVDDLASGCETMRREHDRG